MTLAAPEIRPMTGIRGAAALFVMLYHFHLNMAATGPLSRILLHGYLAVDLFFLLSGFVMAHVYGQALENGTFRQRRFLLHRVARIYPLYLLATLAFMALAARHGRADTPFPVLATNLVMLQALGNEPSIDPPAWSVSTEMVAYLLFPAIAMICLRSRRRIALAAGAAALGTILALTIAASRHYIGAPIANGELDLFFSPYTLMRCLAGFTIGQLLHRLHDSGTLNRLLSGDLSQCAVLLLVIAALAQALSDFPAYLAMMALIAALAQDRGILRRIFASSPLMLLGKVSFGIYLLHFQAIGFVERLKAALHTYGFSAGESDGMATLAACTLVIGLAWILYRGFESPLRRIIRKMEPSEAMVAPRTSW